MIAFEYFSPATVDEAIGLLAEHGDQAKVLAGGQSLVPALNYRLARPAQVIDINALPLGGIVTENGVLRLGALVRHHAVEDSADVKRACPLLAEAAALIGNVRVRSLGTVGGSVAHADPAAELPLVMLALEARFMAAGPSGQRTFDARDFFRGPLTTALAADEIVTDILVPRTESWGAAIVELARRPGDFALVAVAALVTIDARGRVEGARVAFGGIGAVPTRSAALEEALIGHEPTNERVALAARAGRRGLVPESDAFASGAYRAHLAEVLGRRAVTRAIARAMETR
jgi:aerobic carbon-monoxide dehydrogenase medium subunit